jgi:hypothetical protein
MGLLALLGMRVLWLRANPPNSDEPQHAHVAWSVSQGRLPYRDVFDNHGPLFSALYSPLMHLLGARADILWWLRLAVIPWYLLAIAATWYLARRLYSRGVADATALLVALMEIFFIKMGEFRTDDLWVALWLSALAVAVGAGRGLWRWVLVGALTGAALAVSQKTLPLACIALLAAAGVWAIPGAIGARSLLKGGIAAILGSLIVPAAFAAWLAERHALAPAWYDLVSYGLAPTGEPGHAWRPYGYAAIALAIVATTAMRMRRAGNIDPVERWRTFLGLHGLLYALFIWIAWPLTTSQDFLPVIPTVFLWLVGAASRLKLSVLAGTRGRTLVLLLAAVELLILVERAPPWRDGLADERHLISTVLACTAPTDTVMDAKSGAIFRQRPYYPVIESIALRREEHGLMRDDIAASLKSHHTMVVIDGRLPPATRDFVSHNYLPGAGGIEMAGKMLPAPGASRVFSIALPGSYTVSDGVREVAVAMDGQRMASRWNLTAGAHTLEDLPGGPLALVWSSAWRCGWRPAITADGATRPSEPGTI